MTSARGGKRRPPGQRPASYRRRQGQPTSAQRRALRTLWASYGVPLHPGRPLDLEQIFGRRGPLALEIGSGMGEHAHALARAHPERDVLAVEVHRPGLGATLLRLQDEPLPNLRLVEADALRLLRDHLADRPLTASYVICPEPWPRSPERRLIGPLAVDLLAFRTAPGGTLDLASDDPDYHGAMQEAMAASPGWQPIPAEPLITKTRYQARGEAEGRPLHQLRFRRLS